MSVFSLPLFTDEHAAIEKLESIIWPNGPVCVHWAIIYLTITLRTSRNVVKEKPKCPPFPPPTSTMKP